MTEQEARELADLRNQVASLTRERDAALARVGPLNKSAEQAVNELIGNRTLLRQTTERAEIAEKRAKQLGERVSSLEAALRGTTSIAAPIQKSPPTSFVKREPVNAADALTAEARRRATAPDPSTVMHNATCARCNGPAYQGLGRVVCERVGGCSAERDPIILGRHHESYSGAKDVSHESRDGHETAWYAWRAGIPTGPFATRDLAVAAWRSLARS